VTPVSPRIGSLLLLTFFFFLRQGLIVQPRLCWNPWSSHPHSSHGHHARLSQFPKVAWPWPHSPWGAEVPPAAGCPGSCPGHSRSVTAGLWSCPLRTCKDPTLCVRWRRWRGQGSHPPRPKRLWKI
jgi:hypothetical protein